MTISELIEQLEDLQHEVGEDAEVRYAGQPSYPFEYSISDVPVMVTVQMRMDLAREEMRESGMTDEEIDANIDMDELEADGNVVYLAEGRQIGYLPAIASEECGW